MTRYVGALLTCLRPLLYGYSLPACSLQVNYNPAAVDRSTVANVMGIFNAMTTIFFAYGGHNVALEIQATIGITEKNPSTVRPMMRGVNWTFLITGGGGVWGGRELQVVSARMLAGAAEQNCCWPAVKGLCVRGCV